MQAPRPRPAPRPSRREFLRLDLRTATPEQVAEAIHAVLARSDISTEERVQLLGGAFVVEALAPYWHSGRTPEEAHEALCAADPELAAAIEALAPVLLGRTEVREEAARAIASIEVLLGLSPDR